MPHAEGRLSVEHRVPGQAGIHRLEDATGRGPHIDDVAITEYDLDVGYASAHSGGSDLSGAEGREGVGVVLGREPESR
jgi:hypothetical protein